MTNQIVKIMFACLFMLSATAKQNSQQDVEQTPEQLLERAFQAIGGRKKLSNINSFQLHGVMRLPNEQPVVEIELATRQGGMVLGIMTYIGIGQSRFGSDGTTAWEQTLGAKGETSWGLISDEILSQKVQQMNWLEWFTMLPLQLNNMEVVGSEEFDSEPCWKIIINSDTGVDQTIFFSKQTFRPRGRRTIEQTSAKAVTVDVFFRDWERIGELLLFHTIVYKNQDNIVTMKLDNITLNKAKLDLFALPEQVIQLRDKQVKSDEDASD